MITNRQHFDDMSCWVSQRKAAGISGMDRTSIFKNAMRGRFPLRVKDGRLFIFEPSVRDFQGAPIGNPNRLEFSDNALRPASVKAFKALRSEIESSFDDVVYEIDLDSDSTLVRITVFDVQGPRALKPRRLTPQ
jgi:hypothetical protein